MGHPVSYLVLAIVCCHVTSISGRFIFPLSPIERVAETPDLNVRTPKPANPTQDDLVVPSSATPGASRVAARRFERIEEVYQPAEPYNFAYDVRDEYGNRQYRKEEANGQGIVRGSYGYTDANGLFRIVEYVADINGFRANIKTNEPGTGNQQAADIVMAAENPPRGVVEAASAPKPVTEIPPKDDNSQVVTRPTFERFTLKPSNKPPTVEQPKFTYRPALPLSSTTTPSEIEKKEP